MSLHWFVAMIVLPAMSAYCYREGVRTARIYQQQGVPADWLEAKRPAVWFYVAFAMPAVLILMGVSEFRDNGRLPDLLTAALGALAMVFMSPITFKLGEMAARFYLRRLVRE